MREALAEADAAERAGDVPVGAVIVREGRILARGRNRREADQDATAHAEVVAIREACRRVGRWHLDGAWLYVTLEPCAMCAGALVLARLEHLVYGTADPKAGAVDTLFDLVRDTRLNHRLEVTSAVLQDECAERLRRFFAARRQSGQPSQ